MKQIVIGLLGGILLLTACGQTASAIPTTTISASETNPVSKTTPAALPSKTPREPRNERTSTPLPPTPLPTIPTFTLTFDVSTIVTVTPAPKAECPKKTDHHEILLPQPEQGGYPSDDIVQPILNFLNSGGNADVLGKILEQLYKTYSPRIISVDITNDGVPEIILDGVINKNSDYSQDYILICNNGQFTNPVIVRDFGKSYPYFPSSIVFIKDLNADGIPEIITKFGYGSGGNSFVIYGWDGSKFKFITEFQAATFTEETIQDLDNNGFRKIIVLSKDSEHDPDQTIRDKIITLVWNGETFLAVEEYSAPQFRFQAIQDADLATNNGAFQKAISLYQDAIFSDTLGWWSSDRFIQQFQVNHVSPEPTPTLMAPDPSEYPRLAAYAYYRIMLIHLMQKHESDADTVYKTLQQKFGNDQYGQPYVEMATAFWDAYQSTHKMYDGCVAAIQYAAEHPQILTPLGSDYHGAQSHIYVPADVCPFR